MDKEGMHFSHIPICHIWKIVSVVIMESAESSR